VTREGLDQWLANDPIIPVAAIEEVAPSLVLLLHQVCQPKEHGQQRTEVPEPQVSYLIVSMCHLSQRTKCSTVPLNITCFLKTNGLTRKGIDILNQFGVTTSYKKMRKTQIRQMEQTQSMIQAMNESPTLNVTIDNCDIADGVNDERLGDHRRHTSATTGLISHGVNIPTTGLTQGMLDQGYHMTTQDVIRAGVGHSALPDVCT
jgi:hypothetical protein